MSVQNMYDDNDSRVEAFEDPEEDGYEESDDEVDEETGLTSAESRKWLVPLKHLRPYRSFRDCQAESMTSFSVGKITEFR